MEWLEAREGQSSVSAKRLRTQHVIPPAGGSSRETKVEHGVNLAPPSDSQDNFVNTQSDYEQQVRVEQSVLMDTDPV